jgi:hypothetical protein
MGTRRSVHLKYSGLLGDAARRLDQERADARYRVKAEQISAERLARAASGVCPECPVGPWAGGHRQSALHRAWTEPGVSGKYVALVTLAEALFELRRYRGDRFTILRREAIAQTLLYLLGILQAVRVPDWRAPEPPAWSFDQSLATQDRLRWLTGFVDPEQTAAHPNETPPMPRTRTPLSPKARAFADMWITKASSAFIPTLAGRANRTDCRTWGITAREWRQAIETALGERFAVISAGAVGA